jgi:hypothetical protein
MATHDLIAGEVLEESEEDEMIKDLEVRAPRTKTINVSPEAVEDICRINATPRPPTPKMRDLVNSYQAYAKNNPGW